MLVIGKVVDDAGGAVATVDAVVEERLAHVVEPYPGILGHGCVGGWRRRHARCPSMAARRACISSSVSRRSTLVIMAASPSMVGGGRGGVGFLSTPDIADTRLIGSAILPRLRRL